MARASGASVTMFSRAFSPISKKMLAKCWASSLKARMPLASRNYAISVQQPKPLPGKVLPRVFKDKKAFQYNWYMRLLSANHVSPLLILHHNDFTAQRLKKLRVDLLTAAQKVRSPKTGPTPVPAAPPLPPTFTVVRTSIFGAALRDLPGINLAEVEKMVGGQNGCFAVLSVPSLNPPLLQALVRTMDRSVPARPPKSAEELKQEQIEKNADPAQPGRRMKRQRQVRIPELKLMGALIEGQVFLPSGIQAVSKLPTLDTLRAQIIGLLSSPASQLVGILSEASGGKLARTLEGLKQELEETSTSAEISSPAGP